MKLLNTLAMCAAIFVASAPGADAQIMLRRDENQPDMTIDTKARAALIQSTLKAMQEAYVLPEGAARTETAIRQKLAAGAYDTITSAKLLATTLTRDLQEASRDKHLRLLYSHAPLPEMPATPPPSPAIREEFRRNDARSSYGFRRVEQLEGNVGYLDIHDRPSGETRHLWTLPHVPERRYTDKPIYVLTDKTTFSAAEEFVYNLQALKRATVIGEVTAGGAHPTGPRRLSKHWVLLLPQARSVNPITKTNWEGVGIRPDVPVPVPSPQTLATGHLMALKNLLAKATAEPDKATLREAITKKERGRPALILLRALPTLTVSAWSSFGAAA